MTLHATTRLCITPKSPDEPMTRQHTRDYSGTRNWTVLHDPEGTFPAGNRLGQQDIYYGLVNWSFVPGTVLKQFYDCGGKSINRIWTVKLRHDPHNVEILDAYTHMKIACGAHNSKSAVRIAWLRQSGFSRKAEQPAEQLAMAELG